ncbi:MAG: hypothetical protein AAF570_12050 [Bacteroidota bacterium]
MRRVVNPILSYQLGGTIWNPKDGPFRLYLGLRGRLGFLFQNAKPFASTEFPTSTHSAYFIVEPGLGIQYDVSNRLFLELDLPFQFVQFGYTRNSVDDPSVPVAEQIYSELAFEMFPGDYWRGQIALGIRL